MMRRGRADDGGFTLVELLISISILGIILGAISTALIVFLRTGTYATQRDDHSAGAILLSSYLDRDLASADEAPVVSSVSPGGSTCGGSSSFTLNWREYTASSAAPTPTPGPIFSAAYTVSVDPTTKDPDTRCQLTRVYRVGGTVVSTTIIARNLVNGSTAATRAVIATGAALCPTQFTVTLAAYEDDTDGGTPSRYSYSGCVKGRVQ